MKRTILVLTLTLLLSSAAPAGNIDDGDVAGPAPSSSLSSGDQGNTVNTPGTLLNNFSAVIPYLVALLY